MSLQKQIPSPQSRFKDCYASSNYLDLTLRTNGEEYPLVMNALGVFNRAGIDAPTIAATKISDAGSATGPSTGYYSYCYVYAAKVAYTLVESAVTGGGSPAPRSNPSPQTAVHLTAKSKVRFSIPTNTRLDVDAIWLYRTDTYTTAAEAETAGEAGFVYFVAEVANESSTGVVYIDDDKDATQEIIEIDNYPAPQMQLCVYEDPYFYGIGNRKFKAACIISHVGSVALTDGSVWFDGRNGQVARFAGLNTGGFDNLGGFYIQITDSTTALLFNDIALLDQATVTVDGTTEIEIVGPGATLYRSKPRNPLAWGYTDQVGTASVPQLYANKINAGRATAMAILPNAYLLKIDTEAPNATYVFNLKAAGTPDFESSRRRISGNYCASSHFSQFASIAKVGMESVLWGLDNKNYCIVICDGNNVTPVSDSCFLQLRTLLSDEDSRGKFHGLYDPFIECCCFWVKDGTLGTGNNKLLMYHVPSRQWFTHISYDISCSATVIDTTTAESKTLVGTSSGQIGIAFAPNVYSEWIPSDANGYVAGGVSDGDSSGTEIVLFSVLADNIPAGAFLKLYDDVSGNIAHYRIATIAKNDPSAGLSKITVDQYLTENAVETPDVGVGTPLYPKAYIGMIECRWSKSIIPPSPSDTLQTLEYWAYTNDTQFNDAVDPTTEGAIPTNYSFDGLIYKEQRTDTPFALTLKPDKIGESGDLNLDRSNVWYQKKAIPIDRSRSFTVVLRDRGYTKSSLSRFEILNQNAS